MLLYKIKLIKNKNILVGRHRAEQGTLTEYKNCDLDNLVFR